jgi:hypothetical protein
LLSLNALAIPRVGDSIHKAGEYALSSGVGTIAQDMTVISVTNGQYTLRTTTVINNGAPTSHDDQYSANNLLGHEEVLSLLSSCAALGGTRGSVTVAGSTFDSCAIPENNDGCTGTIWVGEVPFGNVAMDVSCPAKGITRLVLPTTADRGGQITYQWGK